MLSAAHFQGVVFVLQEHKERLIPAVFVQAALTEQI